MTTHANGQTVLTLRRQVKRLQSEVLKLQRLVARLAEKLAP